MPPHVSWMFREKHRPHLPLSNECLNGVTVEDTQDLPAPSTLVASTAISRAGECGWCFSPELNWANFNKSGHFLIFSHCELILITYHLQSHTDYISSTISYWLVHICILAALHNSICGLVQFTKQANVPCTHSTKGLYARCDNFSTTEHIK